MSSGLRNLLNALWGASRRRSVRYKVVGAVVAVAVVIVVRRRLRQSKTNASNNGSRSLLDATALSLSSVGLNLSESILNHQVIHQWNLTLKLALPELFSTEMMTCSVLLSVLITRTLLSIWIASIHGSIVRALVDRDLKRFTSRLFVLLLYSLPASLCNASIEYFEKRLALQMREKLTRLCLAKYLSGMVFYQVCSLDLRIQHVDHRLTQDIDLWAKHCASLFTTLTKPLLDIIVISRVLIRVMGPVAPLVIMVWYALSGLLLRVASPDFAKMATAEQKLEAEYRACHSSIVNHSEEIAFYRRLFIGTYDSLLVKYGAFIIGYAVVALPIFAPRSTKNIHSDEIAQITQDYVRHSSLVINLAKAIGRVVAAHKQIQSFIGYSSLLSKLIATLDDLRGGRLHRSSLSGRNFQEKGIVVESSNIEFHHVPIITPDGEMLIKDVHFSITRGQHLFLLGPNGSGKTSLFRVLGGLWPLAGGELHRPRPSEIFYIPQRPYTSIGTLRDQLIYPDSMDDFYNRGGSDEQLEQLMISVQMEHLLVRYTDLGFDAWRYWEDELSGGEKQRIAFARLCYHKPIFAILDEATSAVSADVEGLLYRLCQTRGISLITISHRLSLLKYHNHVLKLDGKGRCQFEVIERDLQHIKSYSSLLGQTSSSQFHRSEDGMSQVVASRSASQQFLSLQQFNVDISD